MNTFAKLTKEKLAILIENLENAVKKMTGLNDLNLTLEINKGQDGHEYLSMDSNELAHYQYPRMFKSMKICIFGGGFGGGWNKDGNFWLSVHYTYDHFSGGSNGSSIGDFFINDDGVILECRSHLK